MALIGFTLRQVAVVGWAGAALAAVVGLGGCVTTTTSSRPSPTGSSAPPPAAPAPAPAPGRDLVTASDESEASRRGRLRLELATRYYAQGQTATALDEVKQSLAANPNQAAAYNLRGLIYSGLNEVALADESFRRALQISPGDADALHNYGWFLCQQRRFADAEAQFSKAVALPQYRERSKSLLAMGVCQARSGQTASAEQTLQRSFELDPGNPATAMNLADLLYRRGDFQRARFYVGRVNEVRELSNAESLWLAARIENKLGNRAGVSNFGGQLRARYPSSREALRYEKGLFDD
jgi:type IV pilus assembly protein PilF